MGSFPETYNDPKIQTVGAATKLKLNIRVAAQNMNRGYKWGFPQVARDFPQCFPEFLKKLLKSYSKNNQKLLFVTKFAQKLLENTKTFFWSDAKICKLYDKSKISKHFCAILVTSVAEQLCPQLKPKDVMIQ